MGDLIFSLSVVLPLILLMMVGYFLQKIKIFTSEFSVKCNKVCFEVFLPCLVFYNVYTNGMGNKEEMNTLAYCLVASLVLIAILLSTVPFIVKDRGKVGVMIQGMFKNNALLFGVPLVTNLYGPEAIGPITVIVSVIVPLYNFVAVVILSIFDPQKKIERLLMVEVLKDVVKNPLIVSAALALTINYVNFRIPEFIMLTVGNIAGIATPLALISLGAGFQFKKLSGNMKYLLTASIFKMILMPAIMIGVAVYLGFRQVQLVTILALFATPIAVSSYVMAQKSNSDYVLAGQLVIMSNLFSVFTIFMFVYILKVMSYI